MPQWIFHNQQHESAAVLARLSVCSATLIWSLIVLLNDDSLGGTLYGHFLTRFLAEDIYGWFFLIISSAQLYRLAAQCAPHWLGISAYGVLAFSCAFILVYWLLYQRPLLPTAIASLVVVTGLAFYAFASVPRRGV